MNTYNKQHLEKVLNWANIHSINDLNTETVGYLTYELEGRVPITTFHVHTEDYRLWRLDHPEIVDVEYDAFTERVIIKATTTVLHDTSLKVFRDWLSDWSEQLTDDENRDEYHCNTLSSVDLRGKYNHCEKQADVALWKVGSEYPRVVIEVGVGETLREDGRRWFEGTGGVTNRAILMNITEENRPSPAAPSDRTWGLSGVELRTVSHNRLAHKILDWHKKYNVPLVGDRIVLDLASVRPGGKITDAIMKVPIPHLGYQIPCPPSLKSSVRDVLSRDEGDYNNPFNAVGSFHLHQLASDLTVAISMELPLERARKIAWDYIVKREMEV